MTYVIHPFWSSHHVCEPSRAVAPHATVVKQLFVCYKLLHVCEPLLRTRHDAHTRSQLTPPHHLGPGAGQEHGQEEAEEAEEEEEEEEEEEPQRHGSAHIPESASGA